VPRLVNLELATFSRCDALSAEIATLRTNLRLPGAEPPVGRVQTLDPSTPSTSAGGRTVEHVAEGSLAMTDWRRA
jgi:hypothetical protein